MANVDVSNLSAFIFDLDGVIWRGDEAIAGAVESITRLQAAGKRCTYCTNNASSTPADYVEKLAALGITAEEDEIMTSALATALYLSSQLTGQFSAYVVGEEGLVSVLRKTGARVVTMQGMNPGTNDIIEDTAFPVDCVIAGIDRSFSYDKLQLAQRFIMNGARFIATNRDATFPVADGVVPGAGAIVSAIETASGVSPLTIGKPQALMPMLLMQRFNFVAETTAFVGDRLNTDMVAANRASLTAIFVATGISTREAAEQARGQQKPNAIFADLPELCQSVLGAYSSSTAPADDTENLPTMNDAAATTAPESAEGSNGAAPQSMKTGDAEPKDASAPGDSVSGDSAAAFAFPANEAAAPQPDQTSDDEPQAAPKVDAEKMAAPSPLAGLLNEDEPKGIEVESSPSPFAFSLEDGAGAAIMPRPAPHLASPGLSGASTLTAAQANQAATTANAPANTPTNASGETSTDATGATITPGTKNKDIDVGEGLDNWWESIEDAFKKS